MINCKTCKKFAILHSTVINGLDEVKLIGGCRFCGYDYEPKTKDEYGNKLLFSKIGESRIDYTDWEELGINR